jgi:hypothetical protein
MGDTALEDTAPCRFPTPKFRSPDGGKRGHGNAVSLPQNVDRPMEAKEDTAMPFPYPKIIDRPDRAHHHHPIFRETALPCPNFFALPQNNRSPAQSTSPPPDFSGNGTAVSEFLRAQSHITTAQFVGKRHCRVRISAVS